MRYLLDTSVLSDLVRNPQGCAMRRITEVGESRVCTRQAGTPIGGNDLLIAAQALALGYSVVTRQYSRV